jgi:FHS family L-fucose permease-like MFS transporter
LTVGANAAPCATGFSLPGFLCFSIVGGAAIPPLAGLVSQHTSYVTSFIVPALCYAVLCLFAIASRRANVRLRDEPAAATVH